MSDLLEEVTQSRSALLRIDGALQVLLDMYWRKVQRTFAQQLQQLLDDMGDRMPTANDIAKLQRLQELLQQTTVLVNGFAEDIAPVIENGQDQALTLGLTSASTMLSVSLPPVRVATLPAAAVRHLVGMLHNDTQLRTYLAGFGDTAAQRVRNTLVIGVASGTNPKRLETPIMQALDVTRQSAAITSRQAVLGAFRGSSMETYRANQNLLDGWTWVSALQPGRTCVVCWAMHGTVHPLAEDLDSHLSCRCTAVPRTKSWAELGFPGVPESRPEIPKGTDLFARLSTAEQLRVLGTGKYELYRAGTLKLPALVEQTSSPKWGAGLRERSLREVSA